MSCFVRNRRTTGRLRRRETVAVKSQPSPAEGWTHDCLPLSSLIFSSKLLEERRERAIGNEELAFSLSLSFISFFFLSLSLLLYLSVSVFRSRNGALLSSRHTFPPEVARVPTILTGSTMIDQYFRILDFFSLSLSFCYFFK